MNNIKLEDGQKWLTRNGNISILKYEPEHNWFRGFGNYVYGDDKEHTTEAARCVFGIDDEHGCDLVELVNDIKLEHGQVWRTRKGELTVLRQYDDNTLLGSIGEWAYAANKEATENARSVFGQNEPHTEDLIELVGRNYEGH